MHEVAIMREPFSQVILILIVGTAGMLLMAGAIILFVVFYQKKMLQEQMRRQALEVEYQKRMLLAALDSQESERNRVSKDLHDDIGMMLMTMRTQVSSLVGRMFSETHAKGMRQIIDETHESVRRLAWNLKPAMLEQFGLNMTVKELSSRLSALASITVHHLETGTPSTLEKNQETMLFRIIQESVTNAVRHAQASNIYIRFDWQEKSLDISIEDDGTGFDFPKGTEKLRAHQGLGILSLENRASVLGGRINFSQNDPTGTIVNILIPLHEQ